MSAPSPASRYALRAGSETRATQRRRRRCVQRVRRWLLHVSGVQLELDVARLDSEQPDGCNMHTRAFSLAGASTRQSCTALRLPGSACGAVSNSESSVGVVCGADCGSTAMESPLSWTEPVVYSSYL